MKCSGLWLVVHLQIEFTYNPPSRHLENEVGEMHPVVAAKRCLNFYRAMLADARASLLPNQMPTPLYEEEIPSTANL